MSVIIKKAPSYRTCTGCASGNDVVDVTVLRKVGRTEQGTQISLCSKCAKEMVHNLSIMIGEKNER